MAAKPQSYTAQEMTLIAVLNKIDIGRRRANQGWEMQWGKAGAMTSEFRVQTCAGLEPGRGLGRDSGKVRKRAA